MAPVVSSIDSPRVRKRPEERREEILTHAARIALDAGLERVTLRAVAERLGVRPGLITHYFPAAEDLVIAAFVRAAARERELLLPATGEPLSRMAAFVARAAAPDAVGIARLWLNARHLARFSPALGAAIEDQEALDRERLLALIEEGTAAGIFVPERPMAACVRILMAMDGFGAYANNVSEFDEAAYVHFVSDAAEWALGLQPETLRRESTAG
ncbi:TetR family transcriptional regulator [Microbacterium sp.]|uniref:TetR family transcriptional regulator n=1 Tax=Microbacterium sp. TaxID=51671 RepID=UPI0039E28D6D